MSSKINISSIVCGHFSTLRIASTGKISKLDLLTFYGVPLLVVILGVCKDFDLSGDLTSLLVNFGSIFTALLLSVLVLIYDQENKIDDKKAKLDEDNETNGTDNTVSFYNAKKQILNELYYTICYCIISSMALVLVSAVNSVVKVDTFNFSIKSFLFSFNLK